MSMVFEFTELAASFVEALLCYYFIQLFFPDKARGRLRFFLLSLILLITVQAADSLEIFPFITTLWFVFYICVTTVIVFGVDGFYAVSLVSFYILCVYIIDFFCISVMGVMLKNRQFAHMVLEQLSFWRLVYQGADKLLLVVFYLLVKRGMKKELLYNVKLVFPISCLGLCGVGFLSWLTIQETGVHALFSWTMCLVLLFLVYFLLLFYSRYVGEQRQRLALQMKDEMIAKEYGMMARQQKEQEELSHDMKNHLLILSSMLEENKTEEAKRYVALMSEPLERLEMAAWTGNSALDVLLNHAKNKAQNKNIRFTIQVDAISLGQMEDKDVCCLFANLLDNAAEAAEKTAEGMAAGAAKESAGRSAAGTGDNYTKINGWITVKMRKAGEMVFVEISNSMKMKAGEPQISASLPEAGRSTARQGRRPLTTKREKGLHGLGLKSAERVVEKYGGTITYEYETDRFTVSIAFFSGMASG